MADEFINSYPELMEDVKRVFLLGDYVAIFDFLQWLLQRKSCPIKPVAVKAALETAGAAYRLLDDNRTIVPISTEEEKESLDHAFADLSASEFAGARSHLAKAANALTSGKAADSIRESINAVESVARTLGATNSLSGALNSLKAKNSIHPALEKSFSTLYGFTSDERGIRHPLLEADKANVNEVDAIFMIGACASFVSYLINKSR